MIRSVQQLLAVLEKHDPNEIVSTSTGSVLYFIKDGVPTNRKFYLQIDDNNLTEYQISEAMYDKIVDNMRICEVRHSFRSERIAYLIKE